jgi:hypothetical protein
VAFSGLSVQVNELSLTSIAEVVTFVEPVTPFSEMKSWAIAWVRVDGENSALSRQDFGSQDGSALIRRTFHQLLVVRDLRTAQRNPECARYDCEQH